MPRPREFDVNTALKQSMTVFWAQGYKATSLDDLMKATSLNKQSLYCAFGDKHSLFLKALCLYRQESTALIKAILNDSNSALEGLQTLFRGMFKPTEEAPGCLMVNTSLEFGTEDPEILAELQSSFRSFEKFVEEAIRRGQQSGEITTRFPSNLMSKSLISTVGGLRILEKRGESYQTLQAILEITLESIRA